MLQLVYVATQKRRGRALSLLMSFHFFCLKEWIWPQPFCFSSYLGKLLVDSSTPLLPFGKGFFDVGVILLCAVNKISIEFLHSIFMSPELQMTECKFFIKKLLMTTGLVTKATLNAPSIMLN